MLISRSVPLPLAPESPLYDEAWDEEMQSTPSEQKIRGSCDGHDATPICGLGPGAGRLISVGRKLNIDPARQPAELGDGSVGTRPPLEGLERYQISDMSTS